MKTVLFFISSFCDVNLRALTGVSNYAKAHGWNLQLIEYDRDFAAEKKGEAA